MSPSTAMWSRSSAGNPSRMPTSRAREQRQPIATARGRGRSPRLQCGTADRAAAPAARHRPAARASVKVAASAVAVRQLSSCASASSVRIDAARAGDLLQDQCAGPPALLGLLAGEVHEAAELLAGAEVVQRHLGQVAALDRDDALVAVLVRPLVDGEGEIAVAEKLGGRRRSGRISQQRLQPARIGAAHSRASAPVSVQSASSIVTGPSPLACTLNEPRNFSAVDSAAASASAWPDSRVTAGWLGCRVSRACASGPSRTSRPRTGRRGRKNGVTPRGTTISGTGGRPLSRKAGVSDIAPNIGIVLAVRATVRRWRLRRRPFRCAPWKSRTPRRLPR